VTKNGSLIGAEDGTADQLSEGWLKKGVARQLRGRKGKGGGEHDEKM